VSDVEAAERALPIDDWIAKAADAAAAEEFVFPVRKPAAAGQ
jgi:hypothetical protein